MSLKNNIIYLYFKGKHLITSKSQYQYNHKQYLYFADLNLPQAFEVHFSNKQRGESKTQIGSNKLVEIPDEYFWSGALEIYAWVYLHSGTDDGETIYEVKIPLIKRAKPTDEEPLPVQQSAIDKAIAELNNAVDITNENADKTNADKTQVATIKEEVITLKEEIDSTASAVNQDAQSARESANASEQSAQNSAESEGKALDYSNEAKGYAQSALESKNTASQKAQVASDASAEAKDFRDEAETFKNEAEQAKQSIVDYRNETKGYRDEALTAKNGAKDSADAAQKSYEDITEYGNQALRELERIQIYVNDEAERASAKASEASTSASQAESIAESIANYTYATMSPNVSCLHLDKDGLADADVKLRVEVRAFKGDERMKVIDISGTPTIYYRSNGQDIPLISSRNRDTRYGYTAFSYNIKAGMEIITETSESEITITAEDSDSHSYAFTHYWSFVVVKDGDDYTLTDQDKQDIADLIPVPEADGMVITATHVDGVQYTIDSTYNDIKTALSQGKTVVMVDKDDEYHTIHPYIGDGYIDDGWFLAFGISATFDSKAVLVGFMIPEYYPTIAMRIEQATPIPNFTDVWINGTSIVENGAANIPIASDNKLGVVKTNSSYGISSLPNGILQISASTQESTKEGTNFYGSIVPANQHAATFYGLAKASGDTTQSQSSNPVGTYTDEAKSSIQTMLDVPSKSDIPVVNVDDVQINGISIVGDGVANIPIASRNALGVISILNSSNNMIATGANGTIAVGAAGSSVIKTGNSSITAITPTKQHESTFYGLAKSAGDTTQSASSNEVGTYTDEAKAAIQSMLDVPSNDNVVNDVQINGGSITVNGVANVPIGGTSNFGVFKVNGNYGTGSNNGTITISAATSAGIKNGANGWTPLTPARQHESAFYGLAKAAGDSTQSASRNAVGTYTEDAKSAISEMLGGSVSVSGTTPTIVAKSGIRYVCGEILSLDFTPPASGICDVVFTSGSTPTVLTVPSTVKWPDWFDPTALDANTTYEINIMDGLGVAVGWT